MKIGKYLFVLYKWWGFALYYDPQGTDKRNPLLISKKIFFIQLWGRKPKNVL